MHDGWICIAFDISFVKISCIAVRDNDLDSCQ